MHTEKGGTKLILNLHLSGVFKVLEIFARSRRLRILFTGAEHRTICIEPQKTRLQSISKESETFRFDFKQIECDPLSLNVALDNLEAFSLDWGDRQPSQIDFCVAAKGKSHSRKLRSSNLNIQRLIDSEFGQGTSQALRSKSARTQSYDIR